MPTPDDVRRLAAALDPQQQQAFVSALLGGGSAGLLGGMPSPAPTVGEAPARVRGFRLRLDLAGVRPPVWRRLELPGDLTLDRLHLVIQAAMGWLDGHLHRFRTGSDHRAAFFVTPFDVEEGEEGVLESDVRLDQLLTGRGDRLWYEYDFGDGWEHVLAVEAVLDEPPATARCTAGRLACPPEDCGGIWGYTELADWVRGGRDPSSVPSPFEDAEEAADWLPLDWHPDRFEVAEAQTALALAMTPPEPVGEELDALRAQLERGGDRTLTELLTRPASRGVTEVGGTGAARLLEPYLALLELVGDGVPLTGAGYLPPALVATLAERTGVTGWWIGKANREDLTHPVATLRDSARALGLVSVRKGRLVPTAMVRRSGGEPAALWRQLVSRLPLGKTEFDRQAGWLTLAVVAAEIPSEIWDEQLRTLLRGLGWRLQGSPYPDLVPVSNPTLDVLGQLSGRTRRGLLSGVDPAVAATARAVLAAAAGDSV